MFKRIEEKKQKKNFQKEIDLAIGLEMERFAEANAEFFKMHSELKDLHPGRGGTKGHGGYVFERIEKAKRNADHRISNTGKKVELTDNLGRVNDTEIDLVQVDKNGNQIQNTGEQLKAFGKQTTKGAIRDVMNNTDDNLNRYDKITVPADRYEDTLAEIDKRIKEAEEKGNSSGLKNLKELKKKIKKGSTGSKDIICADKHKKLYTLKEIGAASHKAGIEAAGTGAVIGGTLSTVKNTKALIDGNIEVEEAFKNISIDTAKSATKSYATAASSAAVGGALKASNKQILNNLAKKNGPTAIVTTATVLTKETMKLISGKVSPEEYAQNIGKEGFSLASSLTGSNIGAIVGTAILPGVGTVVGGFIGGMVASMLSSATHAELMRTIQDTKLSEEKRKIISEYCDKLKQEEVQYRREMISTFNQFFRDKEKIIGNGFENISNALANGEGINDGLEEVGKAFGIKLAFSSAEDFTSHIKKNKILEI